MTSVSERTARADLPPATFVPEHPSLRERARGWLYAAKTTNPPTGHVDWVAKWVVLTRLAVVPMTLFAGLVAGLLAIRQPGFSAGDFVLALVGILGAHVANNVMNDLFDSEVGQDTAAYPRAMYAPHPILSGLTTRRQLAAVAFVVNLVDLAIMLTLFAFRGWPVLAFAIGGFVLSYAYTAPPLRLKKRGLGELDVLVTWGPLMVAGTYYSATGHLPWEIWLASIPYALLCTTVLMGKHTDKTPYDAPLGIRTLPVLLGRERSLAVTRGLIVGCYVMVIVGVAARALPWTALLVFGALPTAVKVMGALKQPAPTERPRNFPVWPLWYAAICFVHVRLAGFLLVVGLAIAAAVGAHAGLVPF